MAKFFIIIKSNFTIINLFFLLKILKKKILNFEIKKKILIRILSLKKVFFLLKILKHVYKKIIKL